MARTTQQAIGESPSWLAAQEHVSRLAPLERPVLVIGERGTGKELIGERLHFLSRRWDGPFVKVNCAALSETLLDSELFGHERGAFTGATERRIGRFELADGGTLFLDEIATASAEVQEKLLRIIEYGEFQRLGGEKVLTTDVRVVAATNVDLPDRAERGLFRADLLDRLAFDVVTLPPLRARPEDISLLADHFARRMAVELEQDFPGFAPSSIALLESHHWPGNVRELRNFAQRVTFHALSQRTRDPIRVSLDDLDPFDSPYRPLSDPKPVRPPDDTHHIPESAGSETGLIGSLSDSLSFQEHVRIFETHLIDQALAAAEGHQGKAAEKLGLSYHQLRGLLKKHDYGRRPGKAADGPREPIRSL
ncbi:MAG: phage shock protein operon transcriptional activator [Pseudomonadota bacterium]